MEFWCETPATPKGSGFYTTAREPKRAHLRDLAFRNTTTIPREDTQRETKRAKMGARDGKKARNFGPPTIRGPLFGAHFSGPPFLAHVARTPRTLLSFSHHWVQAKLGAGQTQNSTSLPPSKALANFGHTICGQNQVWPNYLWTKPSLVKPTFLAKITRISVLVFLLCSANVGIAGTPPSLPSPQAPGLLPAGPPKFFPYPTPHHNFHFFFPLLGVFSWNFGGVFEGREPQMWSSRFVKPRGLPSCRGFTPRFHEKTPREKKRTKMVSGDRKKKREISDHLPLFKAHLAGPPPSGPDPTFKTEIWCWPNLVWPNFALTKPKLVLTKHSFPIRSPSFSKPSETALFSPNRFDNLHHDDQTPQRAGELSGTEPRNGPQTRRTPPQCPLVRVENLQHENHLRSELLIFAWERALKTPTKDMSSNTNC